MKKIWVAALLFCALAIPAQAAEPTELTVMGQAVGIRLPESGVTVTGFTEDSAAQRDGLRIGDVICEIDGQRVDTAAEIAPLLGDQPSRIRILRHGKDAEYLVTPTESEDGRLLGVRVRDCVSGIGTMTYYDPRSGAFGALGHGVCGEGSGKLAAVNGGELFGTAITGVEKGKRGAAGRLCGEPDPGNCLGSIERNTERGIFGRLSVEAAPGEACPLAAPSEIRLGSASVRSTVAGSAVRDYDVKILKIYPGGTQRNLLLEVTDPALLEKTGGIVQGMSGSPILQNGKLIGAVTHVLVNDPTKGYGIFIGNMLDAAGEADCAA